MTGAAHHIAVRAETGPDGAPVVVVLAVRPTAEGVSGVPATPRDWYQGLEPS